jgi:hypothetical protein
VQVARRRVLGTYGQAASGEGSCGIAAHSSTKAGYEEGSLYYWDYPKNVVYLHTALLFSTPLADSVYEMLGEDPTHVQVKELFDLPESGDTPVTERPR